MRIEFLKRTPSVYLAMGACLLAIVSLSGCGDDSGPKLYPVSGVITLDDKPLPQASIIFMPKDAPVATGVSDDQGKFTLKTGGLDGAVAGDHAISVTAVVPGKVMENPTPEDMVKMSTEGTMPGPPKSLIPAKYAVHTSSGLTQTVSEDPSKNQVELKLKSQ